MGDFGILIGSAGGDSGSGGPPLTDKDGLVAFWRGVGIAVAVVFGLLLVMPLFIEDPQSEVESLQFSHRSWIGDGKDRMPIDCYKNPNIPSGMTCVLAKDK